MKLNSTIGPDLIKPITGAECIPLQDFFRMPYCWSQSSKRAMCQFGCSIFFYHPPRWCEKHKIENVFYSHFLEGTPRIPLESSTVLVRSSTPQMILFFHVLGGWVLFRQQPLRFPEISYWSCPILSGTRALRESVEHLDRWFPVDVWKKSGYITTGDAAKTL